MDGDRQLRFAYDRVNELWQGDVMYGPYVKDGRVKRQTYLIDFIDDASRLVVYGRFYWSQRYEELRDAFKEGVLRRGRPSRVFVDNGKIFHTQQFETVCATLGTTLIHSEPYVPNTRGKVERIHRTIRDRFLSVLDPTTLTGLDDLNTRFAQWLDTDYQRKVHSSTGRSPLEYFLSQADSVRLVEDPARLEEAFLLRAKRTVGRDATLHMESLLYETDPRLAGQRVEARYDPAWLEPPHAPLQLYVDNRKVGEAHWVRFQDNAVTRRGRGARAGVELPAPNGRPTMPAGPTPVPEPLIRFTDAMGGDEPCSPSTSD